MRETRVVFISSSCRDLADLRAELAESLSRDRFIVRISEDPKSAFHVDPTDDAISTCLRNVAASDAVLCILDRRYGSLLQGAGRTGLSATHLEVRHARSLPEPKPVFVFVREPALREYEQLLLNRDYPTKWVEPEDRDARDRWFEFMTEIAQSERGETNWCDGFKTVVDLKPLVRKRLVDQFQGHGDVLPLSPERVLRVVFIRGDAALQEVHGSFRNVGPGPAYNVQHGSMAGPAQLPAAYRGGLSEGENLVDLGRTSWKYRCPTHGQPGERLVYCEYENRFGDRYRVEVPLGRSRLDPAWVFQPERFFVWFDGGWLPVTGTR